MIFARRTGWIGIELGTRTLKLAQVERAGSVLRVAASVVMPRASAGGGGSAASTHCHWKGKELAAALQLKDGFRGRAAACVLPMSVTDFQALSMPPAEETERRAMVANEVWAAFSGDGRPREFDFWELESTQETDSADLKNVNVLSVPSDLVSRVVKDVSRGGLHCEAIDGLPFVLARAVKLAFPTHAGAPVAAVDWGHGSSTFCVAAGGRPLYTRHLRNQAAGRLTEDVGRELGLTPEESYQVLAEYGLPDPQGRDDERAEIQRAIAEVTAGKIDEMVEELKRTISYLEVQQKEIVPQRICLLGDGAAVRGIATALSSKVGVAVDLWELPHTRQRSRDVSQPPAAALGIAATLSALVWEL